MIRIGPSIRPKFFGSGAAPLDPDAQAFITAAGITDATQQSAINTLVTDLKGYGIWTKMKAIYPFVGGTSLLVARVASGSYSSAVSTPIPNIFTSSSFSLETISEGVLMNNSGSNTTVTMSIMHLCIRRDQR